MSALPLSSGHSKRRSGLKTASGEWLVLAESADKVTHNICRGKIKYARVRHFILDGPEPDSGTGRYYYEEVPWCECEEEPFWRGAPIALKDVPPNAEIETI